MSQPQATRRIERIVLFNLDMLSSAAALEPLFQRFGDRIVLIGKSRRFGGKYGSTWRQFKRNYWRGGIRFVIFISLQLFLFHPMSRLAGAINRLLRLPKHVYPLRELAQMHGISVQPTREPNTVAFVQQIRTLKPDLIVCCMFDHVIRQQLIEIPTCGVINIHPGLLPDIKGPFPNVWAAIRGNDQIGATVHYVDAETIDTGPIIKRRAIDRDPTKSVLALDCQVLRLGIELAIETIAEIEDGGVQAVEQDKGAGTYLSYPTRDDLRRLRRQGGRLYSLSDFFRQFFTRADNAPS
jgi:folate-dependent phosphoribosylglycinamide formyltransferase PurN